MSAKDIFHQAVRIALKKDGWKVTHDPLTIKIEAIEFRVDLGAERLLAAEKADRKIAVEIKSFLGASIINEFHLALGQFLNYRSALRKKHPERVLYLAISGEIYQKLFIKNQFIQEIIEEYQIKLLIFNPEQMEIILWKH